MANELWALREVFRSPDLRRLELAWLATSIGVWGSALALAIYSYDKGGASAVGVMALFRTLPAAPAAPLLTLIADRRSRRAVLLASNALRAAVLGATAAAISADAPLAAVYALVVVLAIAGPAYRPAQAALFPLLARTPAELSSANVAASMLLNLGFLIGSLAAGAERQRKRGAPVCPAGYPTNSEPHLHDQPSLRGVDQAAPGRPARHGGPRSFHPERAHNRDRRGALADPSPTRAHNHEASLTIPRDRRPRPAAPSRPGGSARRQGPAHNPDHRSRRSTTSTLNPPRNGPLQAVALRPVQAVAPKTGEDLRSLPSG